MHSISLRYLLVELAYILLLSGFTVNYYAPDYLNADVILESVMSLQNVTVFYWGQNRLANFVPLVLSPISDGSMNLYMRMLVAAIFFYLFLWACSYIAEAKIENSKYRLLSRFELFLLLSTLFLILVRPYSIFEIAIWHAEYSLSYLITIVVCYWWFCRSSHTIVDSILLVIILGIATGVNISIFGVLLAVVAGEIYLKKKLSLSTTLFVLFSGLVFLFWWVLSRAYPGGNAAYTTFLVDSYSVSVSLVLRNILDILDLGVLAIFLVLFVSCRLLFQRTAIVSEHHNPIVRLISKMALVFCLLWLLVFSLNEWVMMNKYSARYFFPILFVGAYVLSLQARQLHFIRSVRVRAGLQLFVAIFLLAQLSVPFTPLLKYKVFKAHSKNNDLYFGYAGDYWQVWPSVMYGLINRHESFGFGYRSEGNLVNLNFAAESVLDDKGILRVACLNHPSDICLQQVKETVKLDGASVHLQVQRANNLDLSRDFTGMEVNQVVIVKR